VESIEHSFAAAARAPVHAQKPELHAVVGGLYKSNAVETIARKRLVSRQTSEPEM
jgi:hypothetical protein